MNNRVAGLLLSVLLLLLIDLSCTFPLLVDNDPNPAYSPLFTVFHVTDVHGWVNGHPHQPELNTDFGDFASLVEHLRENALRDERHMFLVDSGDLIEGTGLSDATELHGEFILPIIKQIRSYDAMTMGNHDIGHVNGVDYFRTTFIPVLNEDPLNPRYLTDNQYSKNYPPDAPLGRRFNVLETEDRYRLLVLGFLYNFTQNAPNTEVHAVSEELEQQWFRDAMAIENVDLIMVTCHIDPHSAPELEQIYQALRSAHPDTPLIFFAGHRHQLVFKRYDENAFAIESGKYFENLGLVTFKLPAPPKGLRATGSGPYPTLMANQTYQWINTTMENFYTLANRTEKNFLTERGRETKKMIRSYTELLRLDEVYGCSPRNFDLLLPEYDPLSMWYLWMQLVIPETVYNPTLPNLPYYYINDGGLRYNLFAGPVNKNDIYTANPFSDHYSHFPSVPGAQLQQFKDFVLNGGAEQVITSLSVPRSDRAPVFILENGPGWYFSLDPINSTATYDLICADYDCTTMQPFLQTLFPQSDWTVQVYPTNQTSTSALSEYVKTRMSCRSSCPCPATSPE
mmetsp:Transcript_52588/g.132259  ORF Transcript_52588/g.132259 Transcript_52588/m.132259 type:complete len:567 (-) Transcript_52588:64-1764(-)